MNLLVPAVTLIVGSVLGWLIACRFGVWQGKFSSRGTAEDGKSRRFTSKSITRFVLFAFVLVVAAGWLTYYFAAKVGSDELQMGVLIVASIVTLMTILFILASGFNAMGSLEVGQPLGLPEGSIRAMIALILIMVFIIFGIYLFRIVGLGGAYTYAQNVPVIPNEAMLVKYQSPAGHAPQVVTNAAFGGFDIWTWSTVSDDGKRLAQQLITTVGTLVVAVAGFYFGSTVNNSLGKQPGAATTTSNREDDQPETNLEEELTPEEKDEFQTAKQNIERLKILSKNRKRLLKKPPGEGESK